MKYNRPQATAAWGMMAKDWERGIDYHRLFKERLKRAQEAIRYAGLGAVLCFNFDNIRYVTGDPYRRMGARQVHPLRALPGRGPALSLGPGAAGQAHLLALDRRQCRRADHDHAGRDAAVDERPARLRQADQEGAGRTTASTRSRSASTSWRSPCCARSRPRASRSSTASRRCSTRARSRPPTRSSSSRSPPRWSTPPMSTSPARSGRARRRTNWSRSPTTGCSAWARSASNA